MRLLLIVPPHPGMNGLPLGLASLGLVCLDSGIPEVGILDLAQSGSSVSDFISSLSDDLDDRLLIGITATTPTYRYALEVAEAVKSVRPSLPVVLGGIHATFCDEVILRRHPEIDFVIRGEGEKALPALCAALSVNGQLDSVPNLSARNGERIVRSQSAQTIDLESLPTDIERVLSRDEYRAEMFDPELKTTSTIVGRGCPFQCTYCSESRRFGSSIRLRSVESVLNELRSLEVLGFQSVYFEDDVFTMRRSWVEELCKGILSRGVSLNWHCETRADLVDRELLKRMGEAGCRHIFFGAESANESVLKMARRGISWQEVASAVEVCSDVGIDTFLSIQLGLPGDTLLGMRRTISQVGRLQATQVGVAFTSAYPGTKLYSDCRFPPDLYERYEEPPEITEWFATRVGHGIQAVRPYFLDWDKWKKHGRLSHNFQKMKMLHAWCVEELPNLWKPSHELARGACDQGQSDEEETG